MSKPPVVNYLAVGSGHFVKNLNSPLLTVSFCFFPFILIMTPKAFQVNLLFGGKHGAVFKAMGRTDNRR